MKYTTQYQKIETIKSVEKQYKKWVKKIKEKDEKKKKKENIENDDDETILYDGYFLLPNEIPKSIYDKIDRERLIKKLNRKIKKAENDLINKYNTTNEEKNKINKIKLVLPNKNENIVPSDKKLYPLLEPPNVSIFNQIYATSDIMTHSLNKNSPINNNDLNSPFNNKPILDYLNQTKSKTNINKSSKYLNNNDNKDNILAIDEDECNNKKINNVLYMVKKPNIGLISQEKLQNEINTIVNPINSKNNEKRNYNNNTFIINNIEHIKVPYQNDKENECDCEFYLIPYDSLKSTIKSCQSINRDVIKLTTKNYAQKAASIYKDYNLKKKTKSTSDINPYSINKYGIPIKYINKKSKSMPLVSGNMKELNGEECQESGEKLKDKSKSVVEINQMYYYNSVKDNHNKYISDSYDVKAISLGNLKFHTAFQKRNINEPLMVNGYAPKTKLKSIISYNKNSKNEPSYEEKRLKPYHSYSSYSSVLSSYPSYTFDQDMIYRRKLKQQAVNKSVIKKLKEKKMNINIGMAEDAVHMSIFSLPYEPFIKIKSIMVELKKNYAEVLQDELPNPFKSIHIPYIKLPEKKKRRNFYEVSDIQKAYSLDLCNFVCPPLPVEEYYEELQEPRYAQKVFIKGKRRKRKHKKKSGRSSTSRSSAKSISFNDNIKVHQFNHTNDFDNENSNAISKIDISSKSSSYSEDEDEDDKSMTSYDGIKEEMVHPEQLIKSTELTDTKQFFNEDYSESDSRSKLSSSTSFYSNKDYIKKNNSISSIKIPTEKLYSFSSVSEITIKQEPSVTFNRTKYVQPSLSFNNLLKYDFIRRKKDEVKRLDYLCNNITKEQYLKKENLNIFIHSNPKH